MTPRRKHERGRGEHANRGMMAAGADGHDSAAPVNHRMTFFGETSDYYMKPHSKKKIFYMYDQFPNTTIPQKQIEIIQKGLKADAVGKLLLKTRKRNNYR